MSRPYGRGGGGFRGGRGGGGGGFRGGRGGYGGGGYAPQGPPDQVVAVGEFVHASEEDCVVKMLGDKVPYFNAPIYLENKQEIGKIDEILGPVDSAYFTVKPKDGVQASSFKTGDKFYIDVMKLLPKSRFTGPQTKPSGGFGGRGGRGGGRGGFRGAPRGGGFRGGGFRGAPRGGGFSRGRGFPTLRGH